MNDPVVLIFDVGTQSVRAMLINSSGDILHTAQDVYEQPYYHGIPTGRSSGRTSILSTCAPYRSG